MKMPKWSILATFLKSEDCSQTVLPDRSISKEQKMDEKCKIENLECDILGDFQTLLRSVIDQSWCKKWQG